MNIGERVGSELELQRRIQESSAARLRVSIPGIIEEFDPGTQTATVQPAIKEKIVVGAESYTTELPLLLDVPVVFPRAGGFYLTFPVKKGDECLIVFGDMCIDGWWQSGGVQNQMETRRHDLSDGFAIVGVGSVPEAVQGYATDAVQLRNTDNDAHIEIKEDKTINIKTVENVNVTAKNAKVEVKKNVDILAGENVFVEAEKATVKADEVIVDSGDIKLGAGAEEGVPLGVTLKAWLDGHTHPISWTSSSGSGESEAPSSESPKPSEITKTE